MKLTLTLNTFLEKLRSHANLKSLFFRRALRSAIVAFLSIPLYHFFALTQGYWVTMTAVIVGQSTIGATLRKSFQRFWGTLLGILIAAFLLLFIHSYLYLEILVLVFLFLTYFFNPYSNLINYGFVVIPASIVVVLLISLMSSEKINPAIVYARFYDTAIGAGLGILGTFLIFPNKVKHEFAHTQRYLEKQLADYFFAIMDMFLNTPHADRQAMAKKIHIEATLLSEYQFYVESKYELHFKTSLFQQEEKRFIELSERTAQRLFSLHQQARNHMMGESVEKLKPLLLNIQKTGFLYLQSFKEKDLRESFTGLLEELQRYLANILQQQDKALLQLHWHDIAPFAELHFILIRLIDDITQATDGK